MYSILFLDFVFYFTGLSVNILEDLWYVLLSGKADLPHVFLF